MLELLKNEWKRLLLVMFIGTSVLTTTGCQSLTPQLEVPAHLRQKCLPIQPVEGLDGKAQIKGHTANAAIFWACSDKMDKLIEAVTPKK